MTPSILSSAASDSASGAKEAMSVVKPGNSSRTCAIAAVNRTLSTTIGRADFSNALTRGSETESPFAMSPAKTTPCIT